MTNLKNRRGLSLMEVLIAGGIAAVGYFSIVKLTSFLNKQSTHIVSQQSADVEVERAFRSFARELYNAPLLSPAEGLLAPSDFRFNGVAGVDGTEFPVTNCKYSAAGTTEKASIVRFTQLLDKVRPERVLQVWRESTIATRVLRLSLPSGAPGALPLASATGASSSELVILDADNVDMRRYEVVSATVDRGRLVLPFDHLTFRLRMPATANGTRPAAGTRTFITDSIAFAASTRYSCLSNKGEWILIDPLTRKTETLLKVSMEKMEIEELEFKYAASKSNLRLDPSLFGIYPHNDLTTSNCINTARVRLVLKDTSPSGKSKEYFTTIMLHNFQMRRPLVCDS